MTGDAGMVAKLGDGDAARASHDIHVDLVRGQRLGVILHAGTPAQIAQDDHGHSHSFVAAPRGA
jgi:hypothetical protein